MNGTLLQTVNVGAKPASRTDTSAKRVKTIVMISGGGSNLQALIDAQIKGNLGAASIEQVVCNRFNAYGIKRAQAANIPVHLFNLKTFCNGVITPDKRIAYDLELAHTLNSFRAELIVLAGWMHIFSGQFLAAVKAPIINLHPALPGQFVGAHGIEDAFSAWQKGEITHTGCMVHEVIEQVDAGRVLATATVPCLRGDTLDTLSERMHAAEHVLLVNAVAQHSYTLLGLQPPVVPSTSNIYNT